MKTRIILGFAAIYLIWGSTFLGIKYSIDTIPPFLVVASRFLLAGAVLYLIASQGKLIRFSKSTLQGTLINGLLLSTLGNGLVVWAEQSLSSSVASLWVGTVPLWILTLNTLFFEKKLPSRFAIVGAFVGFLGLLFLPQESQGHNAWQSIVAMLVSALAWSIGTLRIRHFKYSEPMFAVFGIQMFFGGLWALLFSGLTGELNNFEFSQVSSLSIWSTIYLGLIGSAIAYSIYCWLLTNVAPQKVSTYALINPIVAIFLGATLNNEPISFNLILSALFILVGVGLILLSKDEKKSATQTFDLKKRKPMSFKFYRGDEITVEDGSIWITATCCSEDIVLKNGDQYRIQSQNKMFVAEAFENAKISINKQKPQACA